jgi:hypothetical protein
MQGAAFMIKYLPRGKRNFVTFLRRNSSFPIISRTVPHNTLCHCSQSSHCEIQNTKNRNAIRELSLLLRFNSDVVDDRSGRRGVVVCSFWGLVCSTTCGGGGVELISVGNFFSTRIANFKTFWCKNCSYSIYTSIFIVTNIVVGTNFHAKIVIILILFFRSY